MALTKPSGAWTYEDLLALPDDGKRRELVDGELYELPSPEVDHQRALKRLLYLVDAEAARVGAEAFIAPLDVIILLDGGTIRRVVQPDLILLSAARRHLAAGHEVRGAPELVVEVLSPSTAVRDRTEKRDWYAAAGVREYWLADIAARAIEVLVLEHGEYRTRVLASGNQHVTSAVLPRLGFPASAAFYGER